MSREIIIKDPNEQVLLASLKDRKDVKAERIKRLLALPDLNLKKNSPIKILVDTITGLPIFSDFDIITVPKITTVEKEFDILNSPKEHPTRKETDTFFIDESEYIF